MFIQQQYLQYTGREEEIAYVAEIIELLKEARTDRALLDAAIARLVKYHDALEAQSEPKPVPYDQRAHG
jgi:hypothetical protein